MKLKNIELVGFKSFPRRVKLELADRITVLVGPNGCGKSNICDAFVWAFGEQSPRLLRGQRMQEVIFSGTEEQRPINYAQVFVHFTGAADWLKVKFDEIVISRKMFRSGESEFLINQAPCRLRDIQELFMDTGVGARSYSIIPQGQIAYLIDQKPSDRRLIIEEAAGIQKYRHRKKMALARLADTEDNLVRVDQRVLEISRTTRTLKSQSEKAQRFKDLQKRARDLRMRLNCAEYVELSERLRAEQESLKGDAKRQEELLRDVENTKKALEQAKSHFKALSDERDTLERRLRESQVEAESLRLATGTLTEKIRAENQRAKSCRDDIDELSKQSQETRNELRKFEREHERISASLAKTDDASKSAKADCDEARRERRKLTDRLNELQNRRMKTATRLARAQEESRANAFTLERLSQQLISTGEQATGSRTRLNKLRARLDLAKEQASDHQQRLASLEAADESCSRLLSAAGRARDAAAQSRDSLKSKLALTQSRLQTTRELLSQLEGFQEGIRAVAKVWKERSSDGDTPEIIGHLLHAKKGYEMPLEAVLGARLQCLVMDDFRQVGEAVSYLQEHKAGRGSFVAKEAAEARASLASEPGPMAGTLGPAQSFVESCTYPGLTNMLLHDVWVVEDLDRAVSLWGASGNGATFVTLSGEVVESSGVVHGGNKVPGARVLTRQRELSDLEKTEEKLVSDLALAEKSAADANERFAEAQEASNKSQKAIHAAQLELMDERKILDGLSRECDLAEDKMKNLQARVQEIDKGKAQCADRDKELQAETAQLEDDGRQLEASLEKMRVQVASNTKKSSSLESRLSEFAQRRAAAREKQRGASANISRLQADVQGVNDKQQQKKRLLKQLDEEVVRLRRQQTEGSKRLAELERAMSMLSSELDEKSKQQSELATRREVLSREYDRYLEQERKVAASLSDARARASSLGAQLEASLQRIEGEMPGFPELRDVDSLLAEYGRDGPIAAETRGEMQSELGVISDRLQSLGEVNFAAIQDYRSTKDELDFLKRERADIAQSVKLINRTIGKIDSEAKRRFVEAFESISSKFGERFTDLFGGGTARLNLVGSDDVLEAGVEIIAQPHGKRQMSVGLLSGGEKSLAGIALTFALFEHRPAPVCVLDEIDAALDEANTVRFLERVKLYSQSTQFVIITHNRRTMEIADLLYGVTMEKKGVSKLLKLRMEDLATPDAKAKAAN